MTLADSLTCQLRTDFEHFIDIMHHEDISSFDDAFEAFGDLTGDTAAPPHV